MCIFFLIYSMNFTMTYYNAPFSHLLVIWMLRILSLAQMRWQYFHQWEPWLLPSFFLQWDQNLQNWTRVLIRSPGSWAPLECLIPRARATAGKIFSQNSAGVRHVDRRQHSGRWIWWNSSRRVHLVFCGGVNLIRSNYIRRGWFQVGRKEL